MAKHDAIYKLKVRLVSKVNLPDGPSVIERQCEVRGSVTLAGSTINDYFNELCWMVVGLEAVNEFDPSVGVIVFNGEK